MLRIIGEVMSY